MRSFRFVTLDVFTASRFGGNPLAVFADAGGGEHVERDEAEAPQSSPSMRAGSMVTPWPSGPCPRPKPGAASIAART